jgi:hypothetical protein
VSLIIQAPTIVLALFDNTAENKYELSFQKGERMVLVDQSFKGSADWWTCQLRGATGAVPANYVKILPHV